MKGGGGNGEVEEKVEMEEKDERWRRKRRGGVCVYNVMQPGRAEGGDAI